MQKKHTKATTTNALKILDRITGDDPALRALIEEETLHGLFDEKEAQEALEAGKDTFRKAILKMSKAAGLTAAHLRREHPKINDLKSLFPNLKDEIKEKKKKKRKN